MTKPLDYWSNERDGTMMEYVADGYSFTAIARMMGLTPASVSGRFKRLRERMGWQAS